MLAMSLWLILCGIASYFYGKLKFNHPNITKAYKVLEEIIKRDIKELEKASKRPKYAGVAINDEEAED